MSDVAGGLRDRLVQESLYHHVWDGLDALGWFSASELRYPLMFEAEAVDDDEEIQLNTLALAPEDISGSDAELGFNSSDDRRVFYFDLYAESDAVGKHVIGDVRDLLRGRFPSLGYDSPTVAVLDWRLATPTELFFCHVEQVVDDRAHGFSEPWRRHWFSLRCELVDEFWD